MSTYDRFMAKVRKSGDCWVWSGACGNSGYGHMFYNGKVVDAHRISYMLFCGEIPQGVLVLHSTDCNNKKCVNPEHLRLGTQSENMTDWHQVSPQPLHPNFTFKGRKHSDATKGKLSELAMGNKWCVGRSLSKSVARDASGKFIRLINHNGSR